MRNHAACQVAVGIVWFLPLSLSSLLREDAFKVTAFKGTFSASLLGGA